MAAGLTSPDGSFSFLRSVMRGGSKVMQCVAQVQLINAITQRPVKAQKRVGQCFLITSAFLFSGLKKQR